MNKVSVQLVSKKVSYVGMMKNQELIWTTQTMAVYLMEYMRKPTLRSNTAAIPREILTIQSNYQTSNLSTYSPMILLNVRKSEAWEWRQSLLSLMMMIKAILMARGALTPMDPVKIHLTWRYITATTNQVMPRPGYNILLQTSYPVTSRRISLKLIELCNTKKVS